MYWRHVIGLNSHTNIQCILNYTLADFLSYYVWDAMHVMFHTHAVSQLTYVLFKEYILDSEVVS